MWFPAFACWMPANVKQLRVEAILSRCFFSVNVPSHVKNLFEINAEFREYYFSLLIFNQIVDACIMFYDFPFKLLSNNCPAIKLGFIDKSALFLGKFMVFTYVSYLFEGLIGLIRKSLFNDMLYLPLKFSFISHHFLRICYSLKFNPI